MPNLAGAAAPRIRTIAYWVATVIVACELGVWDILRIPYVRTVIEHLGYPTVALLASTAGPHPWSSLPSQEACALGHVPSSRSVIVVTNETNRRDKEAQR